MRRRLLATLLAMGMALSLHPLVARAADEVVEQEGDPAVAEQTAVPEELSEQAIEETVGVVEFSFDEPRAGVVAPSTVSVRTNPPLATTTDTVNVKWAVVEYRNGAGAFVGELEPGATFQKGFGYYAIAEAPQIMSIYSYDTDTHVYYNDRLVGSVSINDDGTVTVPWSRGFGPLVENPTTRVSSYDLIVDAPAVGGTPDETATVTFTLTDGTTVDGICELDVSWYEYDEPAADAIIRVMGEDDLFQEGKYYRLLTAREDGAFSALPDGCYYNLMDSESYEWGVNGRLHSEDDESKNYIGPLGEETVYPYTLMYDYDSVNLTATVTGLADDSSIEGDLVIPSTVKHEGATYTVTAIGDNAFAGRSGFTGTLTLPDSISSIGSRAFYSCYGFTGALKLPAGLTTLGDEAFYRCYGFTGSWSLPEGLETLGKRAFLDCYSIGGTIILPTSVKSIDDYCFYMSNGHGSTWKGVGGLTFAENSQLTRIGAHAFEGNWYLKGGLAFPDSLVEIDASAFASTFVSNNGPYVEGELTLPANIKTIGDNAFNGCGFAGDLVIPDSLAAADASMGKGAFNQAGFNGALVLPEGLTSVPDECFLNCDFTGTLTLPSALVEVGSKSFGGLSKLSGNLVIPASLTIIGNSAFYGFGGTGALVLPDTLTAIEPGAFSGAKCTGALNIPDSVERIGSSAFDECLGFTSLKLPNNPNFTTIERDTFGTTWYGFSTYTPVGFTGELVIPDSVTTIEDYAFQSCENFTGTLKLPSGITSIGREAFHNCTGFTAVELPVSLTTIGYEAFCNCKGLTGNLVIPANVKTIDEGAFQNCTGLDGTLTLPNGLETIGNEAFSSCTSLTGVVDIPNSVTSLGQEAFYYCPKLTGFSLPAGIMSIPSRLFYRCSGMTGKLVIPETVTSIGSYAFSGCSGFTDDLVIPEAVTSIGSSAFSGCSGFDGTLTLPAGLTKIDYNVFDGCSGLTGTLTLPSLLTSIESEAFENCAGFTGTLVIPETVTRLGSSAFEGCSGFTGLDMRQQCSDLSSSLFAGCAGLTGDVVIPSTVTRLYGGIFSGCTGLTGTLTIPATVALSGYSWALYGSHFSTIINESALSFDADIASDGSYYYVDSTGAKADTIAPGTYTRVDGAAPVTPAAPKTYKLSVTSYVYSGAAKQPTVTVTDVNGAVVAAANYTVSYSNNKSVGTATAKITFKGNYASFGSKSLTFTIVPKGIKLSKVTAASRAFTAKWKKQATQTTGYQVQYSTSSSFKKGNKTVTVKGAKTVSKKVAKLKAKKVYYVRVRTYKKVGSKTYYSAWSAKKKVKTK